MIKITHHIDFDFKDRDAADLQKLNKVLHLMKLRDLELRNSAGYLAVTQDGEDNLLEKRYGLDSGTLICTPSKNGCEYQIDTAVTDLSVDPKEFLDIWRSTHPDRVMHCAMRLEFEDDFAYIILHHRRTDAESQDV